MADNRAHLMDPSVDIETLLLQQAMAELCEGPGALAAVLQFLWLGMACWILILAVPAFCFLKAGAVGLLAGLVLTLAWIAILLQLVLGEEIDRA